MACDDFSLERVEADFGLPVRPGDLFQRLVPADISQDLGDWLDRGRRSAALVSEKARSEFLVVPGLLSLQEGGEIDLPVSIDSGQRLDVDPARGLIGVCDFILARTPPVPRLKAPLLTVLEARRGDVELGLGPCSAQMVAARTFDERAGDPARIIHGCVTTGDDRPFLRLDGDEIPLDRRRLYLDNLGAIPAALRAIIRC